MSKDQENALIIGLGAVGVPLTCRVLYEWSPGSRFDTTMALIMLLWMLYFATWVVQRARYARLQDLGQHGQAAARDAEPSRTASGVPLAASLGPGTDEPAPALRPSLLEQLGRPERLRA
ncbi:hypothetical protein [Kocuria sp. U4B]